MKALIAILITMLVGCQTVPPHIPQPQIVYVDVPVKVTVPALPQLDLETIAQCKTAPDKYSCVIQKYDNSVFQLRAYITEVLTIIEVANGR